MDPSRTSVTPQVRTLLQHGVEWRVFEMKALRLPGAASARSLIFDSDAVVRRCWSYPPDWFELPEPELMSLIDNAARPRRYTATNPADAAATRAQNAEVPVAASSPNGSDLADLDPALQSERAAVLAACQGSRDAMLGAIQSYAGLLRRQSVTPETAVVLIKDVLRDGLGGVARCEEPDGAKLLGEGVARGIESYYAA